MRLWPDDSVTFSREAIRLLILFVAQQKPSRRGLWHPSVMQFHPGPLMHILSGVDRPIFHQLEARVEAHVFIAFRPIACTSRWRGACMRWRRG